MTGGQPDWFINKPTDWLIDWLTDNCFAIFRFAASSLSHSTGNPFLRNFKTTSRRIMLIWSKIRSYEVTKLRLLLCSILSIQGYSLKNCVNPLCSWLSCRCLAEHVTLRLDYDYSLLFGEVRRTGPKNSGKKIDVCASRRILCIRRTNINSFLISEKEGLFAVGTGIFLFYFILTLN